MTGDHPALSVITATFDAAPVIRPLVHSLQEQSSTDFEWIVQDGGSTDATAEIVAGADLPSVGFRSESDAGIYDAFNRAVARARGEYVLFLGADDRVFAPDTLETAVREAQRSPEPLDALLCSVVDEQGRPFVSRLSPLTFVFNTVHHQGVLYRRALFDRFRYRTDSRIVADYELNLLLKLRGARTATADIVIAECDSGGVSHTSDEWQLYRDLHELRRAHVPRILSAGMLAFGVANVARRRMTARQR